MTSREHKCKCAFNSACDELQLAREREDGDPREIKAKAMSVSSRADEWEHAYWDAIRAAKQGAK